MNYLFSSKQWIPYLAILSFIGCSNSLSVSAQVKISADSLKKHVFYFADDSLRGRGLATKEGLAAAKYIANRFREIGLKPVGQDFMHSFYTRVGQTTIEGNNVVGMIEGSHSELKSEYIVLGAHFDHISFKLVNGTKVIYNGADDNATGTAGIIEIARALVQQKDQLKRSIVIVAFDAEESGLIGSFHFVDHNTVPIEKVKLMMSLDMIGRFSESNSLIVGAMGTLKGGDDMLLSIAEKHGISIKKTGKKVSNRTDSKPFGLAGIPALHVTSGIIGPYHKPEDDAETIDYEGMGKICNLLRDLTVEAANQETLKPIHKLAAQARNEGLPFFRYGLKANLGSSFHAYPDEFFNGKRKFSAEAGLITQLKITKTISLQPEVMYSTLGSGFNTGNYRTHSITTPVSLVLGTKMNRVSSQRTYFYLGGYYSYHFSGAIKGKAMDFDNTFERTETGLVYGLGMEIMSVTVNLNFKYGLSNIMQDKNMGKLASRATYISVGYMF